MAATLFSAAHLPSPILTTFTLVGGLFFCEMFRRYRSIYPIGIVHAVLGLTIAVTMPDSLLHNMRVGIGYLATKSEVSRLQGFRVSKMRFGSPRFCCFLETLKL